MSGTPGEGRGRRRLRPLTVLAAALLAVVLGGVGWLGYRYVGTSLIAERAYESQRQDLRSRWEQPWSPAADPVVPAIGEPIGLLRIPAFGADYEIPVVEGTDADTLAKGVGHYPGTARPGQVGNFAVAGHRISHGRPFHRLLELGRGDRVVVETRTAVYTYVLDEPPRNLTVAADSGWVLDPVPGRPAARPTQALVTLTTAQDLLPSPDRAVGFGHLESTRNK